MKRKPYQDFDEWHIEQLKDPEHAKAYMQVSLEEFKKHGHVELLLLALSKVAKAQGGIGQLAEQLPYSRQSLYKALSPQGNPRLNTFNDILHGLGYQLSIRKIRKPLTKNKVVHHATTHHPQA